MTEPAISVQGLGYRYRGQQKPALQGIDLEVAEGEFVVVMGPSGAGKSTLCVSLNGLIPHFHRGRMEGEVKVRGRSTRDGKVGEFAKEVGLVFQDFEAQLFSTNVALEVAFGPENFAVEHDEMLRRVKDVLGQVRLEGFEGRQPATLSGGQKQRLAIASVLAIEPRILCLDEPTTDLDPAGKLGVFEIAEELKDRDDVTLIVVEHETEETLDADRIIVLRDGEIIADRPAREVLRDVELLEESGVMPLQVARFFHEMGLWQAQLPLTPEEGSQEFRRRGWRVNPDHHRALVAEDGQRAEGYGEPIIEIDGLSHRYPNGFAALEGVDLTVREGEFLAVLGQNGSGKTTLVKHFNGLLKPTEGTVKVEGEETAEQGMLRLGQRVGYVFQNPDNQIFSETVFDEVS
ncbi:MAG TPA: ATP-binding cassette domain-containing protein, partial [Rubrobacter sp.]|nr:ATP-binding cassette domain-containing protein [Rubrobacter sp.]